MIEPQHKTLWENIRQFPIDEPNASNPFTKKLQQEQNWSARFTNRAIEEYRKFIFLCCILPNGASPSPVVDEVWHLHLTYTHNYWERFCKETLGKEIHHFPSKGGESENEKHKNWFEDTRLAYQVYFDRDPPKDIWQPFGFGERSELLSYPVYSSSFLIKIIISFSVLTALFLLLVFLTHPDGKTFLQWYALFGLAGLIATLLLQTDKYNRLKQLLTKHLPTNVSVFELAKFLRGSHHSYQTVLVDLIRNDLLEVADNNFKIAGNNNVKTDNPMWPEMKQTFDSHRSFTYIDGYSLMSDDVIPKKNFAIFHQLAQKIDYLKLIIPSLMLFTGFIRLLQGLINQKPVGFLVAEIAVLGIFCLVILESYSYSRKVYSIIKKSASLNITENTDSVTRDFCLNGITALSAFPSHYFFYELFNQYNQPKPGEAFAGSSGCGSGCSGGDGCGGGGCGGCGGCGG